jgi:hypothetical protein
MGSGCGEEVGRSCFWKVTRRSAAIRTRPDQGRGRGFGFGLALNPNNRFGARKNLTIPTKT